MATNRSSISDRLRWLENGLSVNVLSYIGYLINENAFYTKDHDDQNTMQNNGVTLVVESMHMSSAKDKSPIYENMSYFGSLNAYGSCIISFFRLPMFGCKWLDNNNGVQIDELGFMRVDLNKEGYKDESFILASQAQQVFYFTDSAKEKWPIVLLNNKLNEFHRQDHGDTNFEDDIFLGTSQSLEIDPSIDDGFYMKNDHDNGIWINPSFRVKKGKTNLNPRKRKRFS